MAVIGTVDFGPAVLLVTVDHDPTSVATNCPRGSFIVNSTTGIWYRKIDDGSSTNVDLASLSSGAIQSGDIGLNAVVSGNIASGSIGGFLLASGIIQSGHIGNSAVVSGSIASGQIAGQHLASGVINAVSGNIVVTSGLMRSDKFNLGNDLSLIPITGNQSVIATWWGLQLKGNMQATVDHVPLPLGPNNQFAVVIPSQRNNNVMLGILAASGQTSDYLQFIGSGTLSGVVGSVFAAVNASGEFRGLLASGIVTSGAVASGSISQFKMASGAITSGHIGNNAVVSGSIASGQIGSFHLASGVGGGSPTLTSGIIQSGHIGNNAVTSGNIASGQIGQNHLASGVGGTGAGINIWQMAQWGVI